MPKRKRRTTKTWQRPEKSSFSGTEKTVERGQPERKEPEIKETWKKKKKPLKKVETREVVYVGTADVATRFGAVTGKKYVFTRDRFGAPVATKVVEGDYPALVSEVGRGCAARNPDALFMSKLQWDLEVQLAKEGKV